MVHINNGILLPLRKDELMQSILMYQVCIMLTPISQKNREQYKTIPLFCGENKKHKGTSKCSKATETKT